MPAAVVAEVIDVSSTWISADMEVGGLHGGVLGVLDAGASKPHAGSRGTNAATTMPTIARRWITLSPRRAPLGAPDW